MRDMLNITAHSGNDGTTDDSLEAIEAGIYFGADAVEVDVRINKNGVLVLSHDEDTEKMYKGHPHLAEAFDLVIRNGKIAINCDVKEIETISAILDLAAEKGIDSEKLILTGSVTPFALEENPAILKQSSVWINIEECLHHLCRTCDEMETIIDRCLRLGIRVLNMPCMETTIAFIPLMKERGIMASVWTVNEEEPLKQIFGLGVLNVTTRNTRLAVETRKASTEKSRRSPYDTSSISKVSHHSYHFLK